jgi:predicted RNase H-like HicB family nuclease/DNA-binding XRE family transcriptional regulator
MYYYAHIWLEENETYSVEFPDLKGCFSMGETLEEAKAMAGETLALWFDDATFKETPRPRVIEGKDIYPIKLDNAIAFALSLRWKREELGLTQLEMARRLNIALSAYQNYESINKSNPTLRSINKIEHILQTDLVSV